MRKKSKRASSCYEIYKLLLCALPMLFFTSISAQDNIAELIRGDSGISKHYTFLRAEQQIKFDRATINDAFRLDPNSRLVLRSEEPDQIGETHYRYYQTYLGYEVENSMFILHTKKGMLTGISGSIVCVFDPKISKVYPSITGAQAIRSAIKSVHAEKYMWENPAMEGELKRRVAKQDTTYFPTAALVWYSGSGEIKPQQMRLAYKIDVYAEKPLSRAYIYIDAKTGEVLGALNMLHSTDAVGTANTTYSGTQTIHSNFVGGSPIPTYRLEDITRGNGISTYHGDMSGTVYYGYYSSNWVLTGDDQAAMDVHYGVSATYDFYKTVFNRNSIDGNGYALSSLVNDPSQLNNAAFDGSIMRFGRTESTSGDGRPDNISVSSIDVTGHELTHGVTYNTSKLINQGVQESGAINESMSDIMGKCVQFWAKSADIDWRIGNDMNWILRDMSNPNALGDPDTYQGTNWYTGTDHLTYVHVNAGVGNFMFYLLVNGGSGINDKGNSYSVSGIGLAKAEQIIYRSETVHLFPNATYDNWRTACIQSANELYGSCSNEAYQVANAWYAVGVGVPATALAINVCNMFGLPHILATSFTALSSISSGLITCSSNPTTQISATTTFTANEITLLPGFTAVEGSIFRAYVTPCTAGSQPALQNTPILANYANDFSSIEQNKGKPTAKDDLKAVVYPNPTQSDAILKVTGLKGAVDIMLTNPEGKVLLQTRQLVGNSLTLPVAHLPGGIYFITVKANNRYVKLKLVKN